jgi:serine/threonine protein kinase/Tfp pilus assembly protein PilF
VSPTPHFPDPVKRREGTLASSLILKGPDQVPTIEVSVFHPSNPLISAAITPPPSGMRKISPSAFSQVAREESSAPGTPLQIGDKILGFELVEELGQGAFARVFLARQVSLAQRPVALKVTLRPTREAEKLARLQHTHIVPVYSVHDAAPVQIICMPYLGRRTIADLIRVFRDDHASRGLEYRKTSGTRPAKTTAFTDARSIPKPTPLTGNHRLPLNLADGETLPTLVGDQTAVLQVLGQLAAGLAHAHDRGILHLDLKPANVLIADTGEPMLLDFNLSFDTEQPERELIGGTVPYMSVEQLQDLRTKGRGQVDARSDLYSLGVMAFEMLTGTVPFPASFLADIDGLIAARKKGPPSLRELNPEVSPAVESMIHKLLAPEPQDRYQSATQFQMDIERHLNDQSLVYARETSIKERLGKWHRRNPRLAGRLLAAAFLGLAMILGGIIYSRSEARANAHAVEHLAGIHLDRDKIRLDLIVPGDSLSRKRGIERATALLRSYGLPDDPNWEKGADVRRLSETDLKTLKGDLGEMLLLIAQARWLEAEGRSDSERREIAAAAFKMNAAARSCYKPGSTPEFLERQSSELARFLGEQEEPTSPRDSDRQVDVHELFLDAAGKIATGRYTAAIESLKQTLEEQPGHAAAHYCLAFCRQQLGQFEGSRERYESAEVWMPTDPRPAYQRGVIYSLQRNPSMAEAEYSRAIRLDREHAQSYRNRAMARMRLNKFGEAEEDLTTALKLGCSAVQIHYLRAEARSYRGDTEGTKADRETAEKLTPKVEGDFLIRAAARLASNDPMGALEDYKAVLAINPRSIAALQNYVAVLADRLEKPDLTAALTFATHTCELHPEHASFRANRAIILARLNRRAEAHQEIEKARRLLDDFDITFRAACVYARTSSSENDDDQKRAIELLKKAIRKGYPDLGGLEQEKDLKSLRNVGEFQNLVKAAKAFN